MTVTTKSSARNLRLGIWPATAPGGNPFVDRFSSELRNQHVEVTHVQRPEDAIGMQIDILHIHWPELVMRIEMANGKSTFKIFSAVRNAINSFKAVKRSGICLVWMVHNITPHDLPFHLRIIWFFYSRALARLVNAFVTLSPGTVSIVEKNISPLKGKPSLGVWHPDYNVQLPVNFDTTRRETAGVLYCSFGLLRPYKGFEEMIKSFKQFGGQFDKLKIAGQPCSAAFAEKLSMLIGSDNRIHLTLRHLSDNELALHVYGSDAIILPFNHYLHSGSLIYALSAGKCVVTPDTPYARALAQEVGEGWLHTYSGCFDFRKVLPIHRPAEPPRMSAFANGVIGRTLEPFYHRVLMMDKIPE